MGYCYGHLLTNPRGTVVSPPTSSLLLLMHPFTNAIKIKIMCITGHFKDSRWKYENEQSVPADCEMWCNSFIKTHQNFLYYAFFFLLRHNICPAPYSKPLSILSVKNTGSRKRWVDVAGKRCSALGRITDWSRTGLPTMKIFRVALFWDQWLATTGWHLLVALQWNDYFWYHHKVGQKWEQSREQVEEHFILQSPRGELLSQIHAISPSLSRVESYGESQEKR